MWLDPRYAWMRQLAAFALLLAVWEWAGQAGMLNPMYAPMPSRIGAALADLFSDGRIWPHLEATFTAALGGLALGIAVGFAFTGACVGEFVAASRGLGYLLSFAQSTYNAALMFALILLILAVVLVIFGVAGRMEKYLLRWN